MITSGPLSKLVELLDTRGWGLICSVGPVGDFLQCWTRTTVYGPRTMHSNASYFFFLLHADLTPGQKRLIKEIQHHFRKSRLVGTP